MEFRQIIKIFIIVALIMLLFYIFILFSIEGFKHTDSILGNIWK